METRTYFANSVPAALEVARGELGPDAMLLNSKPAPEEFRHLGKLEIIFAYDAAPARPQAVEVAPSSEQVSDLDEIRRQLSSLRAALSEKLEVPSTPAGQPLEARLIEAGLSSALARELATTAGAIADPIEEAASVQRQLARRMLTAPPLDVKDGQTKAMAFIGPPGRGKTTSLVKVAIRHGLARRMPIRIYSAGAHPVGAQEQLARYAAILGVPCQAFESLDGLNLVMTGDSSWKGLILIDTPGLAPADQMEMREFEAFFNARPEIEKHIVLRASERTADLLLTIGRFSALKPARILFTGLDESASLSAITETLVRSEIPCSFGGTGQRIPEDLYEMDVPSLARRFAESLNPREKTNKRAAGAGG